MTIKAAGIFSDLSDHKFSGFDRGNQKFFDPKSSAQLLPCAVPWAAMGLVVVGRVHDPSCPTVFDEKIENIKIVLCDFFFVILIFSHINDSSLLFKI